MTTEILIYKWEESSVCRTSVSIAMPSALKILNIELIQDLFMFVEDFHFERLWDEVIGRSYWITDPQKQMRVVKDMFLLREHGRLFHSARASRDSCLLMRNAHASFVSEACENNESDRMESGSNRSRAWSPCFSEGGRILTWPHCWTVVWGLVGSLAAFLPPERLMKVWSTLVSNHLPADSPKPIKPCQTV